MAYYDHSIAMQQKREEESFEALKALLASKDEKGKLHEFYPALAHINRMEHLMEKSAEKIKKYRSFFSLLRELLPRENSTRDVIG